MLSIIVCTFNHAKFLSKCIDSILAQNSKDFELIVVDDASTDNTQEVLSKYSNIKIIKNKVNLNLMLSRKVGFDNSIGENILFVDADDYFPNNKVIENYLKYSDFDIAQSFIDSNKIGQKTVINNSVLNTETIDDINCSFLWNKMFKRWVLEETYKIINLEDRFMYEDGIIIENSKKIAKTYHTVPHSCYYYNTNTGYSHNIQLFKSIGGRL